MSQQTPPICLGALILAAGKGTRMYSETPKVLQQILHEPMLRYVFDAVAPVCQEAVWTVIGHKADMVRAAFPDYNERFIEQTQQLGTGHAVQAAWDTLCANGLTHILVINGDTPLLPAATLQQFANESLAQKADLSFITLTLDDPAAFGRVVRKNGEIYAIIEAKDFDPALYGPEPNEINAGIYCLSLESIAPLLPQLTNANKSGEFYITDLVGLAVAQNLRVIGVNQGDNPFLLGINNPAELVRSEELIRARIVSEHLAGHVMIRSPESVRIGPDVVLEKGAAITGPCELYGKTSIASGAVIESHCVILHSAIGAGTHVRSFSHLEDAQIANACTIGPYARLRPGATLAEHVHVGNFVEIKKSQLAKGAKANHLTYIGDAVVGERVNIGAGTITCNYDGKNKHITTIKDEAFIGSNTALVAPVTVGKKALIGAGSVITRNVPDNYLAIARAPQKVLERKTDPKD